MAITKNHVSVFQLTTSGSSGSITTSTGNCMVAMISINTGGGAITSVTDSASNTYVRAGDELSGDTSNDSSWVFYAKNVAPGITSVKVNYTGTPTSPAIYAQVYDLGGTDINNPLSSYSVIPSSGSLSAGGDTNAVGPTVSVPTGGGIVITQIEVAASSTTLIGSPFTIDDAGGPLTYALYTASALSVVSGIYTPSWSWVTVHSWRAITVAFKSTTEIPILLVQSVLLSGAQPLVMSATKAGNLVVALIYGNASSAVVSGVTDNAPGGSNQYFQCANSTGVNTAAGFSSTIWYAKNVKAGATQITVAFSSGGLITFAACEVSGIDTVNAFDVANHADNQAAGSIGPPYLIPNPSLTITKSNEIIFSVCATLSLAQFTYVLDPFVAFIFGGLADATRIVIDRGTYNCVTLDSVSGDLYCASLASFIGAQQIIPDQQGFGACGQADYQWLGGDN